MNENSPFYETNLNDFLITRIKFFRKKKKYSQDYLSKLANLDEKYINKIENGRHNLSAQTLDNIIRALQVSYNEFFIFDDSDISDDLYHFVESFKQLSNGKQKDYLKAFNLIISTEKEEQ